LARNRPVLPGLPEPNCPTNLLGRVRSYSRILLLLSQPCLALLRQREAQVESIVPHPQQLQLRGMFDTAKTDFCVLAESRSKFAGVAAVWVWKLQGGLACRGKIES